MYKAVEYSTPYLPNNKVRYLMGVGDPIDLIEGVIRGVDIFDCVVPTRLARHGHAYTKYGKINLRNAKFKKILLLLIKLVIVIHARVIPKVILDTYLLQMKHLEQDSYRFIILIF